jgi:hypothetical protein
MITTGNIWNKMLVAAFYREHAGFFLFVFLVFFGVVQPSAQLYFHYALIRGILETPALMALVALAWGLYGFRVRRFILQTLEDPDALFLYKANALPPRRTVAQCVKTAAALLGPVIGYAGIIIAVAITRDAAGKAIEVLGYVILLVAAIAWEMRRRLVYPGAVTNTSKPTADTRKPWWRSRVSYGSILLRFVLVENKWITAAVKGFSCAILFLLLRLQTHDDYDLRMPFLAFSLALFGHGILFHRCRKLETIRLLGYRSLPVKNFRRETQYALFCLALLLPEIIVLGWLTPHPIRLIDALAFAGLGYVILLLLYSILRVWTLKPVEYLKLCLVLFGILYVLVLKTWA